jgi:hypothetical protein
MQFNRGIGWDVAATDSSVFPAVIRGPRVVHSHGTVERIPALADGCFATQAACEAANSGRFIEVNHAGGPIGVYCEDSVYYDNTNGTPSPRYQLWGCVP